MTPTGASSGVVVLAGIAIIVATGLLLARSSPGYGSWTLTAHKLAAVGIVVAAAMRARQAHVDSGLGSLAVATLAAGTVALLVAFGTGATLSAMDEPPAIAGAAHRIIPYLAMALTLAVLPLIRNS